MTPKPGDDISEDALRRFMARHGLDSLLIVGTRGEAEVILRATAEATSFGARLMAWLEPPLGILLRAGLDVLGKHPTLIQPASAVERMNGN